MCLDALRRSQYFIRSHAILGRLYTFGDVELRAIDIHTLNNSQADMQNYNEIESSTPMCH